MPIGRPNFACLIATSLLGGPIHCAPALAQPWPILLQGHQDADPLGRSLFKQPIDFRAPSGFEQVYDLGDGRLARIDGGLIAVFPRSTYTTGPDGTTPTIPPGTTYYIGTPPGLNLPSPFHMPPARSAASTFAGNLITRPTGRPLTPTLAPFTRPTSPARMAPIPTHVPIAPARTMFNDDEHRRRIVESLLQRARDAQAPR